MDTPPPQSSAPPPPPEPPPRISSPLSAEERQMGMFCHLAAFAGYVLPFVGNIVGPLLVWLLKRGTMPFVDIEGKESVNFQISMTIYMLVSSLLTMFCIGLPLLIGLAIFGIIVVVMACIEASNGKSYKYPLCIRFIQ